MHLHQRELMQPALSAPAHDGYFLLEMLVMPLEARSVRTPSVSQMRRSQGTAPSGDASSRGRKARCGHDSRLLVQRPMTELELRSALEKERVARRNAERLLEEKEMLLARNDLLLRESDHRIRNSLQLVAGMLAHQAREMRGSEAAQALKNAESRISGIAAIHEQLHCVSHADCVDLRAFLGGLCTSLATHRPDTIETLLADVESIPVTADRAMKIGTLVNELVTNAFKHAYRGNRRGDVQVTATETKRGIQLVVRDDGIGLPESFDLRESRSLGMRLVRAIVEQIGGTLTVSGEGGAAFIVSMPRPPDTMQACRASCRIAAKGCP